MITNFESITADLTAKELECLGPLVAGLRNHVGKANAIKGPDICSKMCNKGFSMSEPRLRKLINLIRSSSILPVMATSDGYYVTEDIEELASQIKSLEDRRDAIQAAIDGLKRFNKQ